MTRAITISVGLAVVAFLWWRLVRRIEQAGARYIEQHRRGDKP